MIGIKLLLQITKLLRIEDTMRCAIAFQVNIWNPEPCLPLVSAAGLLKSLSDGL
jgi:hypothetical protein